MIEHLDYLAAIRPNSSTTGEVRQELIRASHLEEQDTVYYNPIAEEE